MPETVLQARLRRAWTQQELADFAGVSHSSIQRAESGKPLRVDICKRICVCLGKESPEELGLQCIGKSQEQHSKIDTEGEDDMNRREANKTIGAIVGGALLTPQTLLTPSSKEQSSHGITTHSAMDKAVISQIERLSEDYWQFLPTVANVVSRDLLILVEGHQRTLQSLMRGEPTSPTERRLCCTISTTAQVAGAILYAMKRHPEAEFHYNMAIEYAEKAGNHALKAVALGRMGNFLIDTGKAQAALNPLDVANHLAKESATATVRAWLAISEADAQANLGNGLAGDRAIGKAEDIAALMWPGQDSYRTLFDLSKLEAYKGACYVRLNRKGDIRRAQVALDQALEQLNSTGSPQQSTLLRDLATAYSLEGDIEAACDTAGKALAIAQQVNSAMHIQRLRDFSQQYLMSWKDTPVVRDLDNRLQAV